MPTERPLASDLLGVLRGAAHRGDMDRRIRDRLEPVLVRMGFVGREEFDAVREMAEEARMENQRLRERIQVLEERQQPAGGRAARKKTRKTSS